MLGYTKWTEDQEYRSGEEQKRIPSIIQSHSSNDRQIERPQIIFEMNKLLKDEEVPPSLLANHFTFPGPYLLERIANLQQSAEIKSSSAKGTAYCAYHDQETELTGNQQRNGQ